MLERRPLNSPSGSMSKSTSIQTEGNSETLVDVDVDVDVDLETSNKIRVEGENVKLLDIRVNTKNDRYPFCIVWTPIPGITTLLPFVGHMGIADSRGVIYDFAGPYTIMEDELSFGRTSRYIQCVSKNQATEDFAKDWDQAIEISNRVYATRMHNLCWDNCHSHVKNVLNRLRYRNFQWWNMGILAIWMFFCGRFVRICYSLLPSVLLYGLICAAVLST
mmetsp:Transcript_8908/g.11202  ORF Transcript_8908/g.11202 Transcript_8908/m.11202 type:complete len:219 (+) Transcript_8908:47-703(+)